VSPRAWYAVGCYLLLIVTLVYIVWALW